MFFFCEYKKINKKKKQKKGFIEISFAMGDSLQLGMQL
jgi:hypothetical protein